MDDSRRPATVSRRAALGAVGLGVAGLAGGGGLYAASETRAATGAPGVLAGPRLTVADWRKDRGVNYFIAHRGSGDVYPEHSFPAYDAALAWGAQALEVSVQMTSDRVLVCLHDETYDRTTTITGTVADQTSAVLTNARLVAPQLGPAWSGPSVTNLLHIPRFDDVLRRYGGRMVLCVDAKDADAFGPMLDLVERYGLIDSVIAKVHASSPNIAAAHRRGIPVFGYYGTAVGAADIKTLAAQLDQSRDYLVITPSDVDVQDADVSAVRTAVGTGVATWVGPVHRRYEVERYFAAGATGAVCASYGYQSTRVALATRDAWASRAIGSGEMTRTPGSAAEAPRWTGDADLTLAEPNVVQFLTLGNLSPVVSSTYRLQFEVCWNVLPSDPSAYVSLAFGHADDRYYEARSGQGAGFHAILRANGSLELFSHDDGQEDGRLLRAPAPTPALRPGTWARLRLDVAPNRLRWSRTDGASTISIPVRADVTGGYLHVGRSSSDSKSSLSLRRLQIT